LLLITAPSFKDKDEKYTFTETALKQEWVIEVQLTPTGNVSLLCNTSIYPHNRLQKVVERLHGEVRRAYQESIKRPQAWNEQLYEDYERRHRIERTHAIMDHVKSKNTEIEHLNAEVEHLRSRLEQSDSIIAQLQEYLRFLQDARVREEMEVSRISWLQALAHTSFRNEVEVEVKFICPFVQYLGYYSENISLREAVKFNVGREPIRGEADWVLKESNTNVVRVVIEAKSPSQPIDDTVIDQARSYAFGLNAPIYVVTNGKYLRIYQRGILRDICVIDCQVSKLAEVWPIVYQEIGLSLPTK
jgi:hypothetical protein